MTRQATQAHLLLVSDKSIQSPIAFCPVHGLFPAAAFGFSNSTGVIFEDVKTNCPICGRLSEIIPGTYDFLPGRLSVIVDPSISIEALRALRSIAERLQRNEITAEEAASEASRIDPKFGRALSTAAKIGAWAITAVLSLISLYLQIQANGASSSETSDILEALTEQTAVLEQIVTEVSKQQTHGEIQTGGKKEAEPQPKVKAATEKAKSTRRRDVNRARREALKRRRVQFPSRGRT